MRKVKEQLSSCEQGITVCKTSSQIVFPNMPGDTSRVVGHCKWIPRPDRNRITPDAQRYWKRKMGFWASGRQTRSWKARSSVLVRAKNYNFPPVETRPVKYLIWAAFRSGFLAGFALTH